MNIEFDKSFVKSLDKTNDKLLNKKIVKVIAEAEQAANIYEIRNIKKMVGFYNYYRIRISDYRLGIELKDQSTLRFIIIAHRKDIYKKFP